MFFGGLQTTGDNPEQQHQLLANHVDLLSTLHALSEA